MTKYKLFGLPPFGGVAVTLSAALLAACASQPPETTVAPPPPPPVRTAPPAAPPAPVVIRDNAPMTYVVQPGDTLWGIANRFLLDPWQWPEVWIVNDQVANPHRIYPGDVLTLTWRDGRPYLSRMQPSVRESALGDAIATIPVDAIRHFLRNPRLATVEEMESAPYIVAFDDGHLAGSYGNEAYVRRLPATGAAPLYAIVRKGEIYRDPDDGAVLGVEAIQVAEASVAEPGDPAVTDIIKSEREALPADRLLPIEDLSYETDFYPHAPDGALNGRIIAVFDGVSQIGQYQVIAVNRGSNHGLEAGHVLRIRQVGEVVKDPLGGSINSGVRLPDRDAGDALVFKVTPRLSYALVMEVTRPVHVTDKVENPAILPVSR